MAGFKEHSASSVQISLAGKVLATARKVKYDLKRDQEKVSVLGQSTPYAILKKMKEYTGEVTLLQSEVQALIASLPSGSDITDLVDVDIVVMYITPNLQTVTRVLKGCNFSEHSEEMKEGDAFMEVNLPFMCKEIVYL